MVPGVVLEVMDRVRIVQHSFAGLLWIAAWLFTVGFLQLAFREGVLAFLLWPYYLGLALAAWMRFGMFGV